MLQRWEQQFPGCEPIAHWLRDGLPERWVRFHSLPGSKRYPDHEAEYVTVLDRHNRILGELIGPDRRVVLLTTEYSDSAEPIRPRIAGEDAAPWRIVPMHELEGEPEPNFWHVFAREREWQAGLFDPVIRSVADDEIRNVMIVASDCRWLLHPYDGGMDVIRESSLLRDQLKRAHPDWLSSRPDGQ